MSKNFLWIPVVVVFCACVAAACDETIGDCYPVGQSAGSGDPGVGATGTTGSGPGPSGDEPVGQAQEALSMDQCNAPDDSSPPPCSGNVCPRTCTDMFVTCQNKGMPCTRVINWGATLCRICQVSCIAKAAYRPECYSCGFTDP
jgi:hypothetical protein